MDEHVIEQHRHDHRPPPMEGNETRTRWVVGITLVTMVAEIVVGAFTNSMALIADGWHMASHAGALGITLGAYWFARTRADDRAFSFGTGKVFALAGYTSAVGLALVAGLMIVESVERLATPRPIAFEQALPVAVLGLVVNLVCARLLHAGGDAHDHHHAGDDHNLRAAYLHVLADALTSLLAIAALTGGYLLGWGFLDPIMGIVGGLVVLRWGIGLCWSAGRELLDIVPSMEVRDRIEQIVEGMGDTQVTDLHLWEMGPGQLACIVSVVSSEALRPASFGEAIRAEVDIAHLTVQVERYGS